MNLSKVSRPSQYTAAYYSVTQISTDTGQDYEDLSLSHNCYFLFDAGYASGVLGVAGEAWDVDDDIERYGRIFRTIFQNSRCSLFRTRVLKECFVALPYDWISGLIAFK